MELTREQLEAKIACDSTDCMECIFKNDLKCPAPREIAQTALAYLDRAERAEAERDELKAKLKVYERQVEHEQSS